MGIYYTGFAVLVCPYFSIGADDVLRKRGEELVAGYFCLGINDTLDEKLLICRKRFFAVMLLENYQVTPGLGAGGLGERVVWESQRGNEVCASHHLHSYKRRGGVHHPLRGDECHDTPFAHGVECLQKKIVVYRLGCLTVGRILAFCIQWVCNREVPERDIGRGHVEIALKVFLYILKAFCPYGGRGMQRGQYPPCQQVFFKGHHFHVRRVCGHEGVYEVTASRARFKKPLGDNPRILQGLRYRVNDRLRGIESRQHRGFERVHIPLELPVIL